MPDPLYRRIADDLEQQIASGVLLPGAKLPTEQELRAQFRASRNTVRDAVRFLTTRGLVQTWPGQGTFVIVKTEPYVTTLSADPKTGLGGGEGEAFKAEVLAQGRDPFTPNPRVEIKQAAGVIAEELRLDAGANIVSRHQERYIDQAPSSLQTSYYPMSLVHDGAQMLMVASDIMPGTVKYLGDVLGLRQTRYRDRITVRPPSAEESAFFRLPDSGLVSVLETFRTAFDGNDKPFRLTVSVYAADRNHFAVFGGAVPTRVRHGQSPGERPTQDRDD
ncbi:MAG TPA: GntR family transcriptional regulator [Streptosporangiaceae bacterium]|nr:GntR family transcriptional regulator [Streptosporangiaceae bacterium]